MTGAPTAPGAGEQERGRGRVAGERGPQVGIRGGRVADLELERLADSHSDDARGIKAATLIKNNRLAGHRRLREIALQFHKNVLQAAIHRTDHSLLNHPFPGVDAIAFRIDPHSDN